MPKAVTLLLPGLDGTGRLFESFLAKAPKEVCPRVISLPTDRPRSYHQLAEWLDARAPAGPLTVIAESFSGPLAILFAAMRPERIRALVLCATFATAPAPRLWAKLPRAWLGMKPPSVALRLLLTGGDAALAVAVQHALAQVPAPILASRLREVLTVDVRAALSSLRCPVQLLHASRDRLVPKRAAEVLRCAAPHARSVTLPAPHLLLQSVPDLVWEHLQTASNLRAGD